MNSLSCWPPGPAARPHNTWLLSCGRRLSPAAKKPARVFGGRCAGKAEVSLSSLSFPLPSFPSACSAALRSELGAAPRGNFRKSLNLQLAGAGAASASATSARSSGPRGDPAGASGPQVPSLGEGCKLPPGAVGSAPDRQLQVRVHQAVCGGESSLKTPNISNTLKTSNILNISDGA
ncbi:hypothetical protein MHYP_G00132260 [Metynnis hypsauchen]